MRTQRLSADKLGPGYYWAIFLGDLAEEPRIVQLIYMGGEPTVLVMGRDNTLDTNQFDWLGAVEPPPL